ncbi:uncharacterized protein LOC132203301 [Neocloeon triangulifer]|uniref:uncharacterized protein LOC132203301 n=1 Tax=Neocloeon triangulifer TaxID=2078957 RepID=UPI00286F9890|nr:uncharacterized protein LOC132203301 [Neocloeon triangulifer]
MKNIYMFFLITISSIVKLCYVQSSTSGWSSTVRPSRGGIWPKPKHVVSYHDHGYMLLRTDFFRFKTVQYSCDILEEALQRYFRYLVLERVESKIKGSNFSEPRGYLDVLEVVLMVPCEETPYLVMDEHYELRIDSPDVPYGGKLISHSVWGILRGLETFSQLAAPSLDGSALHLNSCLISDFPRFPHRGLMIDTSRHFLPLPTIFKLIDGMEASKLNTLHWHIVDDQSFPYRSSRFTKLSDFGAYNPLTHVYSKNNVKRVIDYSRSRGIRVIAEFNSPGISKSHSRSWGKAYPELLTECFGDNGQPDGTLGPMNPIHNFTYQLMDGILTEVAELFPDAYIHLGGSEVKTDCWESNPEIRDFLNLNGIPGEFVKLEGIFMDNLNEIIQNLTKNPLVWQEIFDNKAAKISPETIIHVWKNDFISEMQKVTAEGHFAVLSSCWHLDNLSSGGDWEDFYKCEPLDFEGTSEQKRLVIGGEACMWGEFVDTNNVIQRVFPRASAAAERLWSDPSIIDLENAYARLEEFRCRLVRRGVHAQPPNGPGYCPGEFPIVAMRALTVVFLVAIAVGVGAQDEPQTRGIGKEWGPWVWPTRGEVWPKPRSIVNYHNQGYMAVRTNIFRFNIVSNTCDILDDALLRYYRYLVLEREAAWTARAYDRIKSNKIMTGEDPIDPRATFRGNLDALDIELANPCEVLPYQGMDESYELKIDTPDLPFAGRLISQTIWGILRGLETFVQLAAPSQDGSALHMNCTHITDYPRFPYRGLMIDSVRHFLPMPTMYKLIDGMEASKLNTMHWHLVDDQAFPYQSKLYPELSEKGAYNPFSHVYTQNDVKAVIEYCRLRGIRVIPEFDSPGHTRAWGNSHPELLATCYGSDGQPDGSLGPLDPSKETTFQFVNNLFSEVSQLFPERYFHLGGDEVNYTCWASNTDINDYMASIGIAGDYAKLEGVYVDRAIEIVRNLNLKPMVWQEVFDNGGSSIDSETVVHVTSAGHVALLSSCWYLDHLKTGGNWKELYNCEPHDFPGTTEQKNLVLGGEACMWSEYVDYNTVETRVYPRASAMAERLWSDVTQTDNAEAARRLEEFRCRLVRRGIRAQPANGPGYCPGEVF